MEAEINKSTGGRVAILLVGILSGLAVGFLVGRTVSFDEPAPSEGPLSSTALRKNWAKAVTFDAAADGIVY